MKIKEIIIISNSMVEHPSGSDIRVLKVIRQLINKYKVKLILSKDAYQYFLKENFNDVVYQKTQKFFSPSGYFFGIIITYIGRLFQAIYYLPKFGNDLIFYIPTDIVVDVLPGFLGKICNFNSIWIQVIHHLVPHPRERGKNLRNYISYFLQNVSLCLIAKYSDEIIVVNSLIKRELLSRGFADKIVVNGNGIEVSEIDNVKISDDDQKTNDCIFVGRVNYTKGALDLIEIWKEVIHYKPESKLMIVGNTQPEVMAEIEKKIVLYNLSKKIIFKGYVGRKEMILQMKKSKVFLCPSHEEGWGISIAEAMMCRLPTVAYDLPVYKEIFPAGMIQCGIGNIKQMADAVLLLLKNKRLHSKYSKEAYSLAKKYSWKIVAEKEVNIINKILNENNIHSSRA